MTVAATIYRRLLTLKKNLNLEFLFYAYLLLFPFYMPVRALIYDTPLWRDIPITLMVLLVLRKILRSKKIFKFNLLDFFVFAYFAYGIILTLTGDYDFEALRIFRTYFYVCLLYFCGRFIFHEQISLARFNKVVVWLAMLLALDVIVENILINVLYIDKNILPWFVWAKENTIEIGREAVAGSKHIFTRVPTIYGYGHGALLLLGGLGLYLLPFLIKKNIINLLGAGTWLSRYRLRIIITIMIVLGIFLGYIKIVMIVFLLIAIFYKLFFLKSVFPIWRLLLILGGMFAVLSVAVPAYIKRLLHSIPIVIDFISARWFYPLAFLFNEKLSQIIIGTFYFNEWELPYYVTEVRVLESVIQFGLIWLFLYLGINFLALRYCWILMKQSNDERRYVYIGFVGFFLIYLADMLHYALAIRIINMDIWLIFLSLLSSLYQRRSSNNAL